MHTKLECHNPLKLDKQDVLVDNRNKIKYTGYAHRYQVYVKKLEPIWFQGIMPR